MTADGPEIDDPIASTVRVSEFLYGAPQAPVDDLAERYHEASSAYPSFAARDGRGARLLELSSELQASVARSVRTNRHLPFVDLPEPALPSIPYSTLVESRRSDRDLAGGHLVLTDLASLLHAGYGVTDSFHPQSSQHLRAVPSGGALYPLEIYVVSARVDGLASGLYHFDPLGRVLEELRLEKATGRLRQCMILPEPVDQAAAVLVVTALFWRTRFKYGLRGYRFALLEAGHIVQNILLASTALSVPAVPIGGFFDRRLATFLEVDGVNEAPLYALCLGGKR